MAQDVTAEKTKKFIGIEVRPGLTRVHYFFLYFNTFIIGMFMTIPTVVQPAFMNDIIRIDPAFSGSINSFLQNMSQIATLVFVAIIGALSDKTGRRILILLGFGVLAVSFYCFSAANAIAQALGISPEFASAVCASLSFIPGQAAEFASFAPGLLVAYVMRFFVGIGLILAFPQFITMVGDYTSDKDRGRGMAVNGMAMGFSSILVFIIFGVILSKFGVMAGLNTAIIIAVIAAVLTALFMKDRMPEKPRKKEGLRDVIPIVKQSRALKASYVSSLITRADMVVMSTFLIAWGVKAAPELGIDAGAATAKVTLPLVLMGVVSLLAYPVIGILLDKKGRMFTIIIAMFVAAAGLMMFALAPNPFHPLCFIGAILAGIGMSGSIAGTNTLAIDAAPPTLMGAVMGGMNTMQPLGILFFLALGGILFDAVSPSAAFAVKGIATLILAVWLFMIRDAVTKEIKPTFTMVWEEDARGQIMKMPGSVRQGIIEATESYATGQALSTVTSALCLELSKQMENQQPVK
jgi:MFS family permease